MPAGGCPLTMGSIGPRDTKGRSRAMKIKIKQVEAIKATRIHLDPEASGA
jgi:hypothetical protein